MHIPRFFLTSDDLSNKGLGPSTPLDLPLGQKFDILSAAAINQIRNVLRLRAGDRLIVLNGAGSLYRCKIENTEGKKVACLVEAVETPEISASVNVTVALATLKGDRFDWCLQKLTELGVTSIVPLVTARTVARSTPDGGRDAKGKPGKLIRWQAILKEAAEQSERVTIPHIVLPKKIEDFMRSLADGGNQAIALICVERLSGMLLRDIFIDYACHRVNWPATTDKTITLLVGPEGGFTDEEVALAIDLGIKPVSLGPRILRAETAAIFALSQIMWSLEN